MNLLFNGVIRRLFTSRAILMRSIIFCFFLIRTGEFVAQGTYTFNYTGSFQTFTVPSNVISISATITGASGGGAAGLGAQYIRTVAVTPGQVLRIYVGGQGVQGASAAGGFNGGGQAGGNYYNEGSGGGATDIRVSPYALTDRILVAGGGGGGGGYAGGSGGGGGAVGIAGQNGQGTGGGGGTSSAGGNGGFGNGCGNGQAGSLGQGGAGGICNYGGGGGGGGYYGGGGGGADYDGCCWDGSGGGGGSSFPATGGTCTASYHSGHGRAIITATASLGAFASVSPISCNGSSDGILTATVMGGASPYTYTWLPSGSTSQVLYGVAAGVYTLIARDNNAVVYTNTVQVTNPPTLVSSVVSEKSVTCYGVSNGSANVSVTGGVSPYTFTWSPFGGNNNFATGLSGGQYFVDVRDAHGCTTQATVSILQPAPLQIVAFATKQNLCAGESVTLIGGGANSYSWTGGITNGVAFTPVTTASYVVTGMNLQGCTGFAYTTVSVNPIPVVVMSGSAEACYGNTMTLSASGANTYTWTGGLTGSLVAISPTASSIFTVTGSNSFGCSSAASTMIVVNALPNVVALPTSTSICIGQSVTFNASGATSYTWGNGMTGGIPYFLSSSGTYTVTGTNGSGCQNSATTSVAVHQLPVVTVTGPSTICAGVSTQLVAGGALNYSWGLAGTGATITVAPTFNTTYSVVGTDANGCVGSNSIALNVSPLPVVTAAVSSANICEGTQVIMAANGASSYTWMPGDLPGQTQTVSPSSTGIYTVLGSDANQCVGTVTFVIVVNPAPSLSLSAPMQICAGNAATLIASGAQSYLWNTGGANPVLVVTPSTSLVYTITGTSSNGCTREITHTLVVNPIPALNPGSSHPKFCVGQTATLSAGSAFTYTWFPGNIAMQSITVSPSSSIIYTISGTGAGGCKGTATLAVIVNQLPVVSISGSSTLCSGHEQILSGNGADTYTWSNTVISPSIAVSPTIFTVYSVMGADTNGCSSNAGFTVSVLPSPAITGIVPADTVCAGEMVTLSASGGLSYLWSTNDTSSVVNVYPPTGSSFTVWGFGPNGCSSKVILTPNLDECTGITKNEGTTLFEVYPNPNNGQFFIQVIQPSQISIVNVAGKLIYTENTTESKNNISLEGIARGVYFITASNSAYTQTKKLIIQ